MITPKKFLGQNWLINPGILDKIIDAAEINSNDIVLEIGPGTGNLTEKLVKKAGTIIAVEKDYRLIEGLKEKFKNQANAKIVEADILKLEINELFRNLKLEIRNSYYKIVGNIPYYITSHLLRRIFEEFPKPKLIILTIQKEVAQRIIAPSTSSGQVKPLHTNLLALSVQYYAEPEIVGYVSRNNFHPVPKVDSAIIKLTTHNQPQTTKQETEKLFKLIRAGFSEKRKQLAPLLAKKLKIPKEKLIKTFEKLGLNPIIRAENLSLEQWGKLNNYLSD